MSELHFYDPQETKAVLERKLPHWSQAGVVTFLTFRTFDSIPKPVLERWHADRRHWLRSRGINPDVPQWRTQLENLAQDLQHDFYRNFSKRWHDALDSCHGSCPLENEDASKVVSESLLHFDGERYQMYDFVVMPNHIHMLVAFVDETRMLQQCESWKHYTATTINRLLGRKGRFWQQDGFDHLVRSVEQFDHFRRYIADNPRKAALSEGRFRHYSLSL